MRVEYKPSFVKSLKVLSNHDKEAVVYSCENLIDVLEGSKPKTEGLGLKKLQDHFWEIRLDIRLRIIFRWQKDYLEFVLTGSHDQIRKFLKENV